jgi:acyl-coenzyme A thioesterase PaaI-like protein
MSDAPQGFDAIALVDPFEVLTGPAWRKGGTYAFRVAEHHCNLRGVIHGGMLMTLADMTLGQAVWDATERAPSVTLNMQTQFLKPAKAGDLIQVTPELTRRTRGFVFMRGDFKVDGETIMTVQSVWKLLGKD